MRSYGSVHVRYEDPTARTLPRVLADRARTHGSKPYLVEAEGRQRVYSFTETADLANAIGRGLCRRGFHPDDRLAMLLRNSPEYVLAWYGAACAGVVEVPINNDFKGALLEHVIRLTGPRGIVTDDAHVQHLLASRSNLPDDLMFFVVAADAAPIIAALQGVGWQAEAFEALVDADSSPLDIPRDDWELAAILSTSGTTGPSKGVMISSNQMYLVAEQTISLMRLTEADRYHLALPLFHVNAQFSTTYPCLIAGATAVLFERFSPTRFVQRAKEWDLTVANFVGVMMSWVWAQPETPDDDLTPLRCIWSSPTVSEIAPQFMKRFGVEAIVEVYGQTEIGMPFMTPYGAPRPPGAAGLLLDELYEVAIVDPSSDRPVRAGQVGELLIRPKNPWTINNGYWGMPEQTAEARRNMWFHTGDAMRQDEDGWFYLVDRIKDAIRRRGENISSYEVEQFVLSHPWVEECAAVAVPSEVAGGEDEVLVFLVLAPEAPERARAQQGLAELAEWAVAEMPKFMVPRFWDVVTALPKTPSAKVKKAELRAKGISAQGWDRLPSGQR